MVQSAVLKKVLEPIKEVEVKDLEMHPEMKEFETFLENPIYNSIKDSPLHVIDSPTINLSSTKQFLTTIKNEGEHTISITGDESMIAHGFIIVPENVSATLHLFEKNSNAYSHLILLLKEGASLKVGREVFGGKYCSVQAILKKDSKCFISGAYNIEEKQSLLFTSAYLLEPNTTTDISMHGIAKKNAQVSNDTIVNISQKASNSSGNQHMKNIIGDQSTRITSKPILEINNSNVKCSHGASVAPLSQDIRDYGLSRGINQDDLITLISDGFFELVRSSLK